MQQLFYADAKPISVSAHADLSVKTGEDFSFATDANAVPLLAAEFPAASVEYPIVFAGSNEALMPVALLGARGRRNLFLDGAGKWNARYVPAFVRRYPFVFAQSPDGERLALCIDEQYTGCNRDGRGERLFDADGERTAYLEQVIGFLRAYQQQHTRTRAFCDKLRSLDLIVPAEAILRGDTDDRPALSGLRVIDRQKLKALDAKTVFALLQRDELELLFQHLHSLANLRALGERLLRAADDTAPASAEQEDERSDTVVH